MVTLAYLLVIGFVVLTVVYVALSLWSRSVRRARLARDWEQEGHSGDRAAFIREGMERYRHSLRRKLLLGVYVVPVIVVGTIIYLTNFR
jgi:hypothetical protein